MSKPKNRKSGTSRRPQRRTPKQSTAQQSGTYVLARPGQTPQALSIQMSATAGDTFRRVFGPEFEMEEMTTHEVTIGDDHLLQLQAQGIPVYGGGAPISIVCHEWRGCRLYAGPNYDAFMAAQDRGCIAFISLTPDQVGRVMASFHGDVPRVVSAAAH